MERTLNYRTLNGFARMQDRDAARQAFHKSRTSVGAIHHPSTRGVAGHWIHLLSAAAPFAITELVKDADRQSRAIRAVAVVTPLLSEALWTYHLTQERNRDAATRLALQTCEDHSH